MVSFRVRFLRGSAAANAIYVGPAGEMTVNTTDWRIRIHDGTTPGGIEFPNFADLQAALDNFQGGVGSEVEVLNVLTSESTTAALSAAQGKVLKDLIDSLETGGVTAAGVEDMVPGTSVNDKAVTPMGLEAFLETQLGIYYDAQLGDWVNDEGTIAA